MKRGGLSMPLTQFIFFHGLSGQSKIRRGVISTLSALGLGGFAFFCWGVGGGVS